MADGSQNQNQHIVRTAQGQEQLGCEEPEELPSLPAPEPVLPPAPSHSRAPTSRTPSNVSFSLTQRRLSSSGRFQGILETARERAETMGINDDAVKGSQSPGGGLRDPRTLSPMAGSPYTDESSADENTRMMVNSDVMGSYQSLHMANARNRARRTLTRSSHRSQLRVSDSRPTQPEPEPGMDSSRRPGSLHEKKDPWWGPTLQRFQSIELENKGSVARDHLAIERTFLAWLRTSLAFASIGIAVTQLFRLNTSLAEHQKGSNAETLRHIGKPLGATFLAISILILFLGYKRYFLSQSWVMQGKFPASRGTVTIVAFVAFSIMVASLVVVIAIQPNQVEP